MIITAGAAARLACLPPPKPRSMPLRKSAAFTCVPMCQAPYPRLSPLKSPYVFQRGLAQVAGQQCTTQRAGIRHSIRGARAALSYAGLSRRTSLSAPYEAQMPGNGHLRQGCTATTTWLGRHGAGQRPRHGRAALLGWLMRVVL